MRSPKTILVKTRFLFSFFQFCAMLLFALKIWKKHKQWPGASYAQFIPGALIVVIIGTSISFGIHDDNKFDVSH